MATYYHTNVGGNVGGNDWGSCIPIIVLFCIPTPVTCGICVKAHFGSCCIISFL